MKLVARLVCGGILQLLFTLVVIYLSTAWFVSLAPFLDPTSLDYVPAFVWPDPPSVMKRWILDQNPQKVIPCWAVCNDHATTNNNNATTNNDNATIHNNATTYNNNATTSRETFVVKYLRMSFCLTDIAVPLFFIFVSASVFSFVYTKVVVILLWPRISAKWKEEWEEREQQREREEAERKRDFHREQNWFRKANGTWERYRKEKEEGVGVGGGVAGEEGVGGGAVAEAAGKTVLDEGEVGEDGDAAEAAATA